MVCGTHRGEFCGLIVRAAPGGSDVGRGADEEGPLRRRGQELVSPVSALIGKKCDRRNKHTEPRTDNCAEIVP